MKCEKCGKDIPAGLDYCPACKINELVSEDISPQVQSQLNPLNMQTSIPAANINNGNLSSAISTSTIQPLEQLNYEQSNTFNTGSNQANFTQNNSRIAGKRIIGAGKATIRIIVYFIIWYIITYLLLSGFISSLINQVISDSYIGVIFANIIYEGIMLLIIWKASTHEAFRKRTINKKNIHSVMKNLFIFMILFCGINCYLAFSTLNATINDTVNASYLTSVDLTNIKNQAYITVIIQAIGFFAISFGSLLFEKKNILKHTIN